MIVSRENSFRFHGTYENIDGHQNGTHIEHCISAFQTASILWKKAILCLKY